MSRLAGTHLQHVALSLQHGGGSRDRTSNYLNGLESQSMSRSIQLYAVSTKR
jgi:hypothetical protein